MSSILFTLVLSSYLSFADSPVQVKAKKHEFTTACAIFQKSKYDSDGEKQKAQNQFYEKCIDVRFRNLTDLGCEPEVVRTPFDGKSEREATFHSKTCHFVKLRYEKMALSPVKEHLCGEDRQVRIAVTESNWQVCVPQPSAPPRIPTTQRRSNPKKNLR